MFVDFMGVCLDQIYNQAAKFRYMFGGKAETPVVIRAMCGAGFRAAAQHSQMLTPIFTHIPGLKVVCPSNAYDCKGLLIQSIRDNDPVIFLEHKNLYGHESEVPEESYAIPFGEANIVRDGRHATIVTYGQTVHRSVDAANMLAKEGIDCEIIDLRTLSPDRHGYGYRKCRKDRQADLRGRGQSALLDCFGHLGNRSPGCVRSLEGAHPDGYGSSYARAVLSGSGRHLCAHGGCDRRGGAQDRRRHA